MIKSSVLLVKELSINIYLKVVDESHCNANSKPSTTMNCTNEEKCNGTYYTGPWSTCTAE